MINKIVGIDLGTNMGIAYCSSLKNNFTVNHLDWHCLKGKNVESQAMRFIKARKIFIDICNSDTPTLIAYESVKRFMSSDASFIYNGLLSQLLTVAEEYNIPYIGYSPKEIKKAVTGNGNASKDDVIAWALNHIVPGASKLTSDEADAVAIAYYAAQKLCS